MKTIINTAHACGSEKAMANNTIINGRNAKIKVVYANFVDYYCNKTQTKYFATEDEMNEWLIESAKLGGNVRYFIYITAYEKNGRKWAVIDIADKLRDAEITHHIYRECKKQNCGMAFGSDIHWNFSEGTTDTIDIWADSQWYIVKGIDPDNDEAIADAISTLRNCVGNTAECLRVDMEFDEIAENYKYVSDLCETYGITDIDLDEYLMEAYKDSDEYYSARQEWLDRAVEEPEGDWKSAYLDCIEDSVSEYDRIVWYVLDKFRYVWLEDEDMDEYDVVKMIEEKTADKTAVVAA